MPYPSVTQNMIRFILDVIPFSKNIKSLLNLFRGKLIKFITISELFMYCKYIYLDIGIRKIISEFKLEEEIISKYEFTQHAPHLNSIFLVDSDTSIVVDVLHHLTENHMKGIRILQSLTWVKHLLIV